ncbi:MAG: ABC transporter substrate-binding protein [Methanomassiliicoccales archaeon]|nr:ABC transporter substrate-binding protein [Methanomassiliicoccales archaeon]
MTSGKNKLIALFAVAIVVIAGVVIFTADNSKDDGDFTVTDMRGRTVSIPSNVDKIVCLSAGSLRLVEYLGAADMVVGIDKEDSNVSKPTYYKGTYHIAFDVKDIANVGNEENFKAIKDTGAQVIISSATEASKLDDLQDKTGIPVVGIDAGGNRGVASDELSKNLKLLGKVLDKSDRADQLTNYIKDTIKTMEDLSKKSTVIKDAKCYLGGMFFYMKGGLYKTTGNLDPFSILGANNVMPFKEGNPYDTKVQEVVIANPNYMFIDSITIDATKKQFDDDKELLKNVDAVKEGKIYSLFVDRFYGINWESELMNLYYIGSVLDPKVFDYNVDEKMQSVLDMFYPGIGLKLSDIKDKQGPGVGVLDW